MTVLFAYKAGSASAKALSSALGIKRLKHRGRKWKGAPGKTIVNWGSSKMDQDLLQCNILNRPEVVESVTNKLKFFQMFSEKFSAPRFTTSQEEAREWIRAGETVVCRTKLQGHSGEGIVISATEQELVPAPLYTVYTKKKSEWRIHVVRNEVIFTQRKARRLDVPDDQVNWKVRNHQNGFIYEHKGEAPPPAVVEEACKALAVTGLDFGAVDVVWNAHQKRAYVLEVNCAPGLEGTTLERYTNAIGGLI